MTTTTFTSEAPAHPIGESSAHGHHSESQTPLDPISFSRVIGLEWRKFFSTRFGRVIFAMIFLAIVGAATLAVAYHQSLERMGFTWMQNISLVLTIPGLFLVAIAVIVAAEEWTTRCVMTTFTLVPRRGLVFGGKFIVVTVLSLITYAVSLLGAVASYWIGCHVNGEVPVWEVSAGFLVGLGVDVLLTAWMPFALALALQSIAGSLVAYFALPSLLATVAMMNSTVGEIASYLDLSGVMSKTLLKTSGAVESQDWLRLATAVSAWIVIPGAIGFWRSMRREVS